jgi:hypothetical protein
LISNPDVLRIGFDYSLDEAIDANDRFIRGSPAAQSARRRSVLSAGLVFGGAAFVVGLFRLDRVDAIGWTLPLATGIALGAGFAALYSLLYERSIRSRVRSFLHDHARAGSLHCEIELTPEGVRVRQPYTEIFFDWRDAVAVVDAADAIELHFEMGMVLARNRAFATAADRAEFLSRARTLADRAT